jgi:hypothetical protein
MSAPNSICDYVRKPINSALACFTHPGVTSIVYWRCRQNYRHIPLVQYMPHVPLVLRFVPSPHYVGTSLRLHGGRWQAHMTCLGKG